jgi:hypothetical protein
VGKKLGIGLEIYVCWSVLLSDEQCMVNAKTLLASYFTHTHTHTHVYIYTYMYGVW